jgi:hypothetical protein
MPVQPGAGGGHSSAPADDPGADPPPNQATDGQVAPVDAAPALEAPPLPPPFAPLAPLAVDDGPPVPPELDDLVPPPTARHAVSPPAVKGKKATRRVQDEPVVPTPPPWDYGPVPSPATAPGSPAAPVADRSNDGGVQEVAAPTRVVRPALEPIARPLTPRHARDSLAAMALTLIVGTGWNVLAARRRRHGWY